MIRYVVLVLGAAFYAFTISNLLTEIRNLFLIQARRTSLAHSSELWILIPMASLPRRKWMISSPAQITMARKLRGSLLNTAGEPISMTLLLILTQRQVHLLLLSYQRPQTMCWRCCSFHKPRPFETPQAIPRARGNDEHLWSERWWSDQLGRIQHCQPNPEEAAPICKDSVQILR